MEASILELIFSHSVLIVGGIFAVWLLIKLFKKPIKLLFKLACNTGIGYISLFLLNRIGAPIGLSLGFNWVNALVVGVFGYPGLILLVLLKYFF
ncbi:MAG: pro-sigmaK processing inhibitor BofA family protein [Oscillospiraceae bacterium]|nr:pro-sigmaK processing inhibitor BofA family protein [Oscillospiraceae bacterium]